MFGALRARELVASARPWRGNDTREQCGRRGAGGRDHTPTRFISPGRARPRGPWPVGPCAGLLGLGTSFSPMGTFGGGGGAGVEEKLGLGWCPRELRFQLPVGPPPRQKINVVMRVTAPLA